MKHNKIACLYYHSHSSTAQIYVTDMLQIRPSHSRKTCSSSYTMPLLNRPTHSKATLGDRSFSFASSSVWNSIPNDVRCDPSLSSLNFLLKTYLFCSVHRDSILSLITVHMCMFVIVIDLLMAILRNTLCNKKEEINYIVIVCLS